MLLIVCKDGSFRQVELADWIFLIIYNYRLEGLDDRELILHKKSLCPKPTKAKHICPVVKKLMKLIWLPA